MSYSYLLNLYQALGKRVAEIEDELETAPSSDGVRRHQLSGRRDCLKTFHAHLLDRYDRKLPRRMQQKAVHHRRD